jgi:transposase
LSEGATTEGADLDDGKPHRYVHDKLRYPSGLTDAEWQLIKPLIPPAKRGNGKPTENMREVVNGMMYVLSTGCHQRPATARRGEWLRLLVGLERQDEKIHDALYIKCRERPEREASPDGLWGAPALTDTASWPASNVCWPRLPAAGGCSADGATGGKHESALR